jgi:uncharacterized protein YndB with AHSA1/START domain
LRVLEWRARPPDREEFSVSASQVPDEIRRDVTIDVGREQVWAALTEPDHLKRWFPTKDARVDLRVGGEMYLEWDDMSTTGTFDEIDPPNRLVYRWHPAGDDHPSTTVEFTLTDAADGGGTLLTVVERGFAQLPAQNRANNVEGWTSELQELVDYATTLKTRH